jgi:phosphoglycerate dehydrogenase-like enzyme/predicted enzyme related to lactoylglutathione lyase
MKIIQLDSNHPYLKERLILLGFEVEDDFTSTKTEIEQKIDQYEGLIIRSRFKIDQAFLEKATHLKFIARVGAGLENIDETFAAQKGIHLIAAPEGNRNAVGEHALGMILSLFNQLKKADLEIRSGQWKREENRGIELEGKTIGLIGYGNMGKAFAKKLKGFEVKVLCYDIKEGVGDENCEQVSLAVLQEKTDVLSIHTPENELSYKMVNTHFINQFKKPFYLINTARGSAVETADLVDALKSGKILGACLDVLEYEKSSFENFFENETSPKPFQYLIKSDQVLLSPHVAGWTVESHLKLAKTIADKIEAIYFPDKKEIPKEIKRVTGIGGLFFKAENPEKLKNWYQKHLGFNTDTYGCTFWWKDSNHQMASTQWSPFTQESTYFEPCKKDFMFNYRVANLKLLLEKLKEESVTIVGEMEETEYGNFGWILDPEGNKIELWEPIDKAFLG